MKPYPEYKDSGVEWLGKIPEHWEPIKIKFFSTFDNGYAYSSSEWSETGFPVFRMSNISSIGTVNFTEKNTKHISEDSAEKTKRYRINKGDILIAMTDMSSKMGILAKPVIFDENIVCYLNQRVGRIVINENLIKRNYFFYATISDTYRNQVKETVYPNVQFNASTEQIINSLISYPPLSEQKQIAKYLGHKTAKIDSLIEKKKKLIELLKEERTNVINQAVTKGLDPNVPMKDSGIEWLGEIPEHWKIKKIKHVADDVQTGITPPSNNSEYFDGGDINWFTPSDFNGDLVLNNSKRKITSKALSDRVAKMFPFNSVFLVGIGATLGKIGLIEKQSSCNQQINPIIFNDEFNPFYGAYFLMAYGPIIISLANASTLAILNQSQTKELLVLAPPLEEQKIIVKQIENETTRIDSIISKSEKEIELLQEYRTALISEVVTGKIDVREEKV